MIAQQMNRRYFQSLSQERLVEVADNLHKLATELWEKQQQNSANSSQPPSTDNPYTSSTPTKEELALVGKKNYPIWSKKLLWVG